jgi:hypothetical protein
MSINLNTPRKVIFACIYGIAYGFFIALSPIGSFFHTEYCYDLGGEDFFLGRMQLVTSICAALAFYALTSITTKGWKGFLKTIAVSFLCFYLFSIFEIYQYIGHNSCFVPKYPDFITVKFFIWVLFFSVMLTVPTTIIFMPVWLVSKMLFNPVRRVLKPILSKVFPKKNFISLDLKEK